MHESIINFQTQVLVFSNKALKWLEKTQYGTKVKKKLPFFFFFNLDFVRTLEKGCLKILQKFSFVFYEKNNSM